MTGERIKKALILAGGQGKRMKTDLPKVLLCVLEKPMLTWVTDACEAAGVVEICVVKGFGADKLETFLGGKFRTVMQAERLGTGHAVMQAREFLADGGESDTLILCGDAPFLDSDTIEKSYAVHIENRNAVTVVTAEIANPAGYGRILRSEDGDLLEIREDKDCTAAQKQICEVNSGCYWFNTQALLGVLDALKPANAQGEYYLTDCVGLLLAQGKRAGAYQTENPDVVLGANDRRGLLALNNLAREVIIGRHLDNGVEFVCTSGVVISPEVQIGRGTKILSGVVLRGNTQIGENCVIGPNCVIENTTVGDFTVLNNVQAYDSAVESHVKIGPFVQLRPGSVVKKGAKIGDFVEIKNSIIGERTAVAHLTYVGDCDVGKNVNFGCGVVTVNYDGENKFRTQIGDNAFIGCNTNLIAPVEIGSGAYTAAGSTVSGKVPANALVIERGRQTIKEGYAEKKLKARTEKFAKLEEEQ